MHNDIVGPYSYTRFAIVVHQETLSIHMRHYNILYRETRTRLDCIVVGRLRLIRITAHWTGVRHLEETSLYENRRVSHQ